LPSNHDKIATRLGIILNKLNQGERFSIDDLVEEFNVSKRTIQRDMNERFSYLPLQKENGYYFLEEYCLGKLNFEDLIRTPKDTKPEIKTLEFIKNVIFSDEKLFGSYGKKIEFKKSSITGNYTPYILEDKQKTLKLFQKGDSYYKETALGGCISVDPCDSFLTNSLTE